jgi:Mg2+/Co2+ transporter CorB
VDPIPLWVQLLALFILIFLSAIFAMAETALMASNRHRLRHLAERGSVQATITFRELNMRLSLNFPLDGPKTLNGLLLEELQDIPEASISLKINDCIAEIVQVQNHTIKTGRLYKPVAYHPHENRAQPD